VLREPVQVTKSAAAAVADANSFRTLLKRSLGK
jgi:hypothetical protein